MPLDHSALPPLSLYVHIPWCVRKCPYCDFNSHASPAALPEQAYVKALLEDLDAELQHVRSRDLQSIFIGGGTPSLFSASAIATLLDGIRFRVTLADQCEITLEANPGTVEQSRFDGYRQAGVNRLSIGIQSLNDTQLKQLGRIHSGQEAHRAVACARKSGFDNINLDMMYGLERQSLGAAMQDLEQLIALAPEHISWYQLTIEPNTAFYNLPPELPVDDALADIEDAGLHLLAEAGYARYEVSAFAKAGVQSIHNTNYWEFGDYLGIGAGAHAKTTDQIPQGIHRRHKKRQPDAYLNAKDFIAAGQCIEASQLPLEFMLNALRLTRGVSSNLFEQRTGLALDSIKSIRDDLVLATLLEPGPERIVTTPLGFRHLNSVLAHFGT